MKSLFQFVDYDFQATVPQMNGYDARADKIQVVRNGSTGASITASRAADTQKSTGDLAQYSLDCACKMALPSALASRL